MPSQRTIAGEIRATATLAFPMILGQLGGMSMNWVDSGMVGNGLGTTELAGLALSGAATYFFIIPGFGMTQAVTVLVSRAVGAGKTHLTQRILRHGLIVVALYSSLVTALLFFGLQWLGHPALGQDPGVVAAARTYLAWFLLAIPPMLLFACFRGFSEAQGRTWTPFFVLLAGVSLNVLLNWILIFGNWGAPAIGIAGAGLATVIAQLFSLTIMATIVIRSRHFAVGLQLLNFLRCKRQDFGEVLHLGLPSTLQIFFEVGAFNLGLFLIGTFGEVPQAAHQIVLQFAAMAFMVPLGLSFAMAIRIGQAAGNGDAPAVRRIGFSNLGLVFLMMSVSAVTFALFNDQLPHLFENNPAVIELAATMLLIAAFFQFFDGTQVAALGALRGLKDVRVPTLLVMFGYWGLAVPLGILLAFFLDVGPLGLWYGITLGLAFVAVSLVLRFALITRKSGEELRVHQREDEEPIQP